MANGSGGKKLPPNIVVDVCSHISMGVFYGRVMDPGDTLIFLYAQKNSRNERTRFIGHFELSNFT